VERVKFGLRKEEQKCSWNKKSNRIGNIPYAVGKETKNRETSLILDNRKCDSKRGSIVVIE